MLRFCWDPPSENPDAGISIYKAFSLLFPLLVAVYYYYYYYYYYYITIV